MKTILSALFLISLVMGLSGCRDIPVEDIPGPRSVAVELAVRPDRMTTVTRSADETAIRDINFYLCDKNGNVILHRYQTSATLRFECVPTNYLLRVAANMGRDLGNNPVLEDFTLTHKDAYDALPMAWEGDIMIPASGGSLPTVEVQRAVAKISYDISVKPSDMELLSVQLLSVPRTVSVFDVAASPSDDPDDYTDCPETRLSGRSATGTSYLLPNMQGVVPSITDQRDKNVDNAPENASYLLIRATRGAKALAYYVYLGENNTSDFNVRANAHYRFNISILGDSEVDTRVSSYELNVYDTYGGNMIGGYCTYDIIGELFIEVDGDPAPLTLRGHISASQGDTDRFLVDDASIETGLDLSLPNQPGLNEYFLYYDQTVYTESNSQVNYTVTVEDDGGYAQSFDFERRFANRLDVIVDTFDNGKGKVTVSDALYSTQVSGTRDHIVMCHQMGCTLVALPAAGYRFDGWYTTDGYTTRLSISTTYFYVPKSTDTSIYPKFTANTWPLEAELTPPTDLVTGLSTKYTLTLSGTDSPEPMNVKITCSDPQVVFTLPDGRHVTSGATASFLCGTHEIALTPRAMGGLTVTTRVTDCLGESVERAFYKEVRYPKSSAFLRTMSAATVYSDSPLTLRISTTEYDGDYSVSCNSSGQACRISYGGKIIYPDEHVTLRAGSHAFTATSYNAGNTDFTFTVIDSYGQSTTARGTITWK